MILSSRLYGAVVGAVFIKHLPGIISIISGKEHGIMEILHIQEKKWVGLRTGQKR